MPMYFEYHHRVLPGEIDGLGHANNVAYFSWMQSAALGHSAAQGWPAEAYQERGWAWMVRTHQIEYRRPVLVDQTICLRTWVAEMTRFTSRRKFEFFRGESLVARAETNWAFVDLNGGKLHPIPAEISLAFEIAPGDRAESSKENPA